MHPIKKLRKKNKLTQVDFSKIMGIKQGTLSKIENNMAVPTIRNICTLKRYIKFNLEKMCNDITEYYLGEYNE